MSQFLKLAHLVDDDCVPQMKIRRRRIKSYLDPQWSIRRKALEQLLFEEHFLDPAFEFRKNLLRSAFVFTFSHRGRILPERGSSFA